MMLRTIRFTCLTAALFALPAALKACPNCKEAVESSSAVDEDPLRESRAYNRSIYLMLAVPYTIIGSGMTYCFFAMKRRA